VASALAGANDERLLGPEDHWRALRTRSAG